jgi:flagellar biosynthetic protein FliR
MVAPSLLVGLRIAPVFALAPPFSLVPVPVLFRVLFGIAVAATLQANLRPGFILGDPDLATWVRLALGELLVGSIFVLAFQVAFGALYVAGRTIDIQAGFGLATLIDPTTQTQMPLVGTLFAFVAGALFFAMGGLADLLQLFAASLRAIPLGSAQLPTTLARLAEFMGGAATLSLGVGGGATLSLFVVDLSIAALSRTVPQMNVLVLGFQVKTILLLLVLPATLGVAGVILARLMSLTLETIPRLS